MLLSHRHVNRLINDSGGFRGRIRGEPWKSAIPRVWKLVLPQGREPFVIPFEKPVRTGPASNLFDKCW